MTLTLNSAPGSSVPNWQLITSSAPTGVSTVTYSGLSGYSKYRILAPNLVPSGSAFFALRINADSGANYNNVSTGIGSSPSVYYAANNSATSFLISATTSTTAQYFQIDIDHALLLTPKFISGTSYSTNNAVNTFGNYITTSAITSITLLTSANNFSTGTIYLLGAN